MLINTTSNARCNNCFTVQIPIKSVAAPSCSFDDSVYVRRMISTYITHVTELRVGVNHAQFAVLCKTNAMQVQEILKKPFCILMRTKIQTQ